MHLLPTESAKPTRTILAVVVLWTAVICGCKKDTSNGNSGENGPQKVVVEFPEGDPSVPPDLGGPGFTGEGWQTATPGPLGDPRAVKGGAVLTYIPNWPENLRTLGTGSNTYLNSIVESLCLESLLGLHPVTLEPIPALASHWKISEDKMTFHYRINPKAHWSDGKPVVAEDLVATYRLIMDDTLVEPMRKQAMEKMEEPKALSKYIIEVKCKKKHWRNFLTMSALYLLPAHEIGGMTGGDYLKKYQFSYTALTGPYHVKPADIRKNESLTVTRRSDYWAADEEMNQGLFNFDRMRFVVIRDQRLAFDKACKGELDFHAVYTAKWWVENIEPLETYKQGHLIRQKIYTRSPEGSQGMAFNQRRPPLDDVRVRKGLAHLYDRQTLLEKFAYSEYDRLKSYFPGGDYENPNNKMVEYDPQEAMRLLEEAGFTERGSDGVLMRDGDRLSITIMYRAKGFEKYLTSYQEACRKVGVEVKLNLVTPETHWKNMMERTFQVAGMGWSAILFPNPESNWSSKMADQNGSNNITGFKSDKADEIIQQYNESFSVARRAELLRELDAEIFRHHPYSLEWYIPCQRVLYQNKFGMPEGGFSKYDDWRGFYTSWWIDPEKEKALKEAKKTGATLPVPPYEIKHWVEDKVTAGVPDEPVKEDEVRSPPDEPTAPEPEPDAPTEPEPEPEPKDEPAAPKPEDETSAVAPKDTPRSPPKEDTETE